MTEVDRVLQGIDYKSFFEKRLPDFSPNGRTEVSCLCPFHEDRTASLSVNTETGLWHCFGCGDGGNAIDFLMKTEGCEFKEALERIKREHGIADDQAARPKAKPSPKKDPAYLSTKAIDRLHNQLMGNPEALKIVKEGYGLEEGTLEAYRIGWQNGKIVVPFEHGEDQWTWKEHKAISPVEIRPVSTLPISSTGTMSV